MFKNNIRTLRCIIPPCPPSFIRNTKVYCNVFFKRCCIFPPVFLFFIFVFKPIKVWPFLVREGRLAEGASRVVFIVAERVNCYIFSTNRRFYRDFYFLSWRIIGEFERQQPKQQRRHLFEYFFCLVRGWVNSSNRFIRYRTSRTVYVLNKITTIL